MKRIKFPLVMKNGAEARDMNELRENFDMESLAENYISGKLEQWLINNYYDDILEKIQSLTGREEDFGERLAGILGVDWKNEEQSNLRQTMEKAKLKEQIKPYVSEEKLAEMEHIADTQEEFERLVECGCQTIYLFGETFTISRQMEGIECFGINSPRVSLEMKSREEFREKRIKLHDVTFPDDEMERIAVDTPPAGSYLESLNVLFTYLKGIQRTLNKEDDE